MFNKKTKPVEHKTTMYIEKDFLKVLPEVQRDINLEDLVNNHTRFYDDKVRAFKDGYIPLSFAVTVRSVYTNLVILSDGDACSPEPKYFVNLAEVEQLPHRGYDLIMYLCSVALFNIIEYKQGFDEIMMKSEFQPIGLYNPDPELVTPVIYCHVYIDDEMVSKFDKFMKPHTYWRDIEMYLQNSADHRFEGMLNTLIISEKKEEETCSTEEQ